MSDRPQSSIDRIRDAVAVRVHATSLRSVARQVGMSPSGLDKFLSGGTPYAKSRRKLFDWLQRERDNLDSGMTADGIAASLGSLVRDLPPERRERALYSLMDTLRGLYETHTELCPPWLGELAAKTADGTAFEEGDVPRSAGPRPEFAHPRNGVAASASGVEDETPAVDAAPASSRVG